MTIVYIADDGTHFDNEWECKDYEWLLTHRAINDVQFLDKDGDWLEDIFSEDAYNNVRRIIAPNVASVHALVDLERYTGFCAYADIDGVGTWVWHNEHGRFEKERAE